MSGVLGILQLVLLTGSVFALAAALLCAALEKHLLQSMRALHPAAQARALSALAAAPLVLAVVFTGACFMPSLLGPMLPGLDHCLEHLGHAHLCLTHLPSSAGRLLGWGALGLPAAYLGARAEVGWRSLREARRLVNLLCARLERSKTGETAVLDVAAPVCLAAGIITPRVIVSRSLVSRLRPAELAAALAHEHAHRRRRDSLRLLLARVFASLHLPRTGKRILSSLELASELACDEEAAQVVGDRLVVADAIVSVARLLSSQPRTVGLGFASFGACAIDARVCALLEEPRRETRTPHAALALILTTGVALASSASLHHATETLLSLVTH